MTLDLGTARGVDARAFGKPGERTFQLRIMGATEETAALWLEKQQFDLHVGRMAVGYDPADKTVVIQAHDLASDEDGDPDVIARITSANVAQLSTRLKQMIAGGRPTCPLCSVPLSSSGHTCIRSNGHSQEPVPRGRIDDDNDSGARG